MSCPACSGPSKRFGKHRNGLQRFRCRKCAKTFTEDYRVPFRSASYLEDPRGLLALQLLLEGSPIRAAERISGLHRNTVLKLLVLAGSRCVRVMERYVRNVPVRDVQCDEIWGFIGKKENNKGIDEDSDDTIGDTWCWVAIERYSKLVLAFTVGRRTLEAAIHFTGKLRDATAPGRFQLTTDGLKAYLYAVDLNLSDRVDFAQLIKFYSQPQTNEQRYSPAEIVEAVPVVISGNPDPNRICTSHVERQNLTMRMQIRRLTRLTNAFSKKLDNHAAAIALHFAYYNFCRQHGSLRVTPAMEAKIADHIWSLPELLTVGV